ncbi:hypothetical protein HHI36_009769, partial [Cryptolaemus montrouzieri]
KTIIESELEKQVLNLVSESNTQKEEIIDLKNEIAVRDEQVLKTNNRAKTMESDFIESEKQLANANKKNEELQSTLNVKDNIIKSMKLGDHKIEEESERNKFTN